MTIILIEGKNRALNEMVKITSQSLCESFQSFENNEYTLSYLEELKPEILIYFEGEFQIDQVEGKTISIGRDCSIPLNIELFRGFIQKMLYSK